MKSLRKGNLRSIVLRTVLVLGLVSGLYIASAELPEESRGLLEKLAEFEKQERAKAEATIAEKRKVVVGLLEAQMKERTKKGELDPALAIMEAVETLKKDVSADEAESMVAVAKAPEVAPEPASGAPRDAVRRGGSYYKAYVVDEPVTWEEARKECQAAGGELAWFDSPDDEDLIRNLLANVNEKAGHTSVWVGGKKDGDGNWVWINGEPVDPDFWAQESDAVSSNADDVMVRWIGSFKPSGVGSTKVGYLCRWE